MKTGTRYRHWLGITALLLLPGTVIAASSDEQALTALLTQFLANAGSPAAHERFWADDLVYTSSNGTRTTKAAILASMRAAAGGAAPESEYSARDVDIRLYGNVAVVAFRLVQRPADGPGAVAEYFNTGTFLKREGAWRAVAWQATKIPPVPDESGD